jgi:hypothetical protein
MLNRNEADLAGLHEPLNGWIAKRAHPEDSVGLPAQERVIRTLVARADETEILPMQAEVFRYPEKRLKLSPLSASATRWPRRSAKLRSGESLTTNK